MRIVQVRRIPRGAVRVEVPCLVQQQDYTCGATAVLAVSRYFGTGPASEGAVVCDMGFGTDGSDPAHLVRVLRRYRLHVVERRGMSAREVCAAIDRGQAVIVMLQAWGDRTRYRGHWRDGHWVVVIGYDPHGIYIEDPMIESARGFLSWAAFADRWHDIEGRTRRRTPRYGVIVSGHRARRAQRVRAALSPG
jgi:ABC-type bacteriocin/lantibiotic exporter with double-glycine peptidase domain